MANTIQSIWTTYDLAVIADTAGTVQRRECRRAFFAGAAALRKVLLEGVSKGEETTEEDESLLESIDQELQVFQDNMLKGKA